MAVVLDSASLGPCLHYPSLIEKLSLAQLKLRTGVERVMSQLDECEGISLVFLTLQRHHLIRTGHKLCQYIHSDRTMEAMNELVSLADGREGAGVESVVEGLYAIGRHDLLHHHLDLTVTPSLHTHYKTHSTLEPDRKALYCVFSGMAQEQADGLFSHSSLSAWTRQEGQPLEETFLRNLALTNYTHLLSQLWYALSELNPALAAFLQPHLHTCEVVDRSPTTTTTTTGHLDSDPDTNTSHASDTNTSHASAHHLDLYPFPTDYPYGLCIIFNVRSFIEPSAAHDQIPLTRRHGSEVDCARLSATFKLFGFHVMTYIDPDLHLLQSIFLKLRTKPEIALVSCLAICFMTHGDEYDNLYLHDRSYVGITYLRKLCFTSALINKPRLFFIQACRGEQALRPILLQQDVCTVTHAESDCLISLATVQGYTAVRSQTEGSWYVSEVCAALQECGHVVPVRTVLQRARTSLSARIDTMDGGFVTMLSEEKVTLTRYVQLKRAPEMYFVEGIMDLVMMEVVEQLIEQALEQAEGEQEQQEEALAPSLAALQLNS